MRHQLSQLLQPSLYRRKLREAWHRGGDLDDVTVPPAPN